MQITLRNAFAEALGILRELKGDTDCALDGHGNCTGHGPTRTGRCPQFRLKTFLRHVDMHGGASHPYTDLSLTAMIRGCTTEQEVHAQITLNGTFYTGRLVLTDTEGEGSSERPFHVEFLHREPEPVSAHDIYEAYVSSRTHRGFPTHPNHEPE